MFLNKNIHQNISKILMYTVKIKYLYVYLSFSNIIEIYVSTIWIKYYIKNKISTLDKLLLLLYSSKTTRY